MFSFWKKKPLVEDAIQQRVVAAIQAGENKTTGEIRVFLESRCTYVDAMDRAWELFASLGMANTERRNAVLLYMAIKDRQFAIVGDKEIYEKAGGPLFWENAAHHLRTYLANDRLGDGIVSCVDELGNALAQHFPYDPAITKNELPDDIIFGK